MSKAKKQAKVEKFGNGNGNGKRINKELLERLNLALSFEYAATIQYMNQQALVKGHDRQDFAPFFAASSTESHLHAQNLGNKIVALGGEPTFSPAKIRQSPTLQGMLKDDLEMEREALTAYVNAWETAGEDRPLKFWLEDIIREEQLHVDELEKLSVDRP
jgi:bacterioferritin